MLQSSNSASSVLGWTSIGCWIIVYSPQIIENYQLKSGEGLSVAFVLIWFSGDLTNLIGAILANLLPTVIILPIYYSLCDIVLLFQIYYYRHFRSVYPVARSPVEPAESTPLLPSRGGKLGFFMLLRRLAPYVLGTAFVLSFGAVAYWRGTRNGSGGHDNAHHTPRQDILEWKSQVLGWTSAVLYLGSRIPQIFKNMHTKCAGLSPVLFFFAIVGNATYTMSILVVSTEARYLAVNASWLAGSVLTIFLDLIVLAQFIYFRALDSVSCAPTM